MTDTTVPVTTRKDWSSDQEVRWCPGCGDYSILAAVQLLMPELGVRREPVAPANPYWARHGLAFADPDGFHVILVSAPWDP